jgi:hypothetical protein
LLEMQVAEKRQQDEDRIAFAVVVGAGVHIDVFCRSYRRF